MSKKLIIIRGPQGSGKTTMVGRAGLEGFSLSLDKIRDIIAGDALDASGRFGPNHEYGPLVGKFFGDSIDRRISAGEVVCLEGTFANGNELYTTWKKFSENGYKTLLIDLYDFDDGLRLQRNAARGTRQRVPEASVQRMRDIYKRTPLPPVMLGSDDLIQLRPVDDAAVAEAIAAMPEFLQDPRTERDLSRYREVIHIGDLQGSCSPLLDPKSPVRGGLRADTFYVFLGDLFDRGKENGEVADWFIRNALGRPNVAFIAGNHEDYVDMQAEAGAKDIDLPDSEWVRRSWPQIKAAGLDHRHIRKIASFSQDYLAYTWRDERVLCSHAGFARWPSNMDLVSRHQLRRGNGHYSVDIDAAWSAAEERSGRVQIHGHRNDLMRPTLSTALSFNLEGQVEFGGHLRILRLNEDGYSSLDIRPTVFRTMQEDVHLNKEVGRMSASKFPPILPWAEVGGKPSPMAEATVKRFGDHRMIMVKEMNGLDGIASVNFTREAFHNAQWDEFTTVARGLFIDTEDRTIVARSYPKFFNHGEREETTGDGLTAHIKFPVTAYEKLNGFLCITGYSERLRKQVICSKSRTDGDFADMAASVLRTTLGEGAVERIERLNRDQVCSLVFEIEEPNEDPHIIKLDKPRAVLLACIRRSEKFEQADYKDLKKIADWIGCEVKAPIATLPNEMALASFHRRVEHDPKWTFNKKPVEGAVLEDASGFHYKLKGYYYRNWKFMRSAVREIARAKETMRAPRLERFSDLPEQFIRFMDWAQTLSVTALKSDIISLRDSFEGDRKVMEQVVDEVAPLTKQDLLEENFRNLVGKLAANEKASPDGIRRFISSALNDPFKAGILEEHADYETLKERAGMTSSNEFSI